MDISVEKVQKVKTISRVAVSLETPVGRDGESALGDLIEDRSVGSPEAAVIDSNVRDETANILKTLSPKQERVIWLRFGIGCEREHTLEEIGQEFGVTRERVRQIEAKALRESPLAGVGPPSPAPAGCLLKIEVIQQRLLKELRTNPKLCERVARLQSIASVGEVLALTWALETNARSAETAAEQTRIIDRL